MRLLFLFYICNSVAFKTGMGKDTSSAISDKVGITSAVLCTIHCLVIPALFLLKGWYADSTTAKLPHWWESMDSIFLVISFVAVYHSSTHTKVKEIRMALWASWCLLALAIVFSSHLHWLTYVASAGLISTHFINIRRIRRINRAYSANS